MRIAYVTTYDATNIHEWSGLGYHIGRSLEQQGIRIECIGPLTVANRCRHLAKKALYRPFGKRHLTERQPDVVQSYADQINARLRDRDDIDAVFSPGSIPLSLLDCRQPTVFWTDAPFAGLVNFYPEFSILSKGSIDRGHEIEQAALSRCSLALYSSDWAARAAIESYDVDPAKVRVIPFGANVVANRSREAIERAVDSRPAGRCRLLFLGREWHRKGGDRAVAIAEALNAAGIPTELAVAGCKPRGPLPDFVTVYGFVSKSYPEGRKLFDHLLSRSHLLIQPSRSEAYGLAFAEASSHGVPSIATAVGGIPSVVRNHRNGITFSPEASIGEYVSWIGALMLDPARYRELALASFQEYRSRLNWAVAGRTAREFLLELTGKKPQLHISELNQESIPL